MPAIETGRRRRPAIAGDASAFMLLMTNGEANAGISALLPWYEGGEGNRRNCSFKGESPRRLTVFVRRGGHQCTLMHVAARDVEIFKAPKFYPGIMKTLAIMARRHTVKAWQNQVSALLIYYSWYACRDIKCIWAYVLPRQIEVMVSQIVRACAFFLSVKSLTRLHRCREKKVGIYFVSAYDGEMRRHGRPVIKSRDRLALMKGLICILRYSPK